jgi:hypothetical protein
MIVFVSGILASTGFRAATARNQGDRTMTRPRPRMMTRTMAASVGLAGLLGTFLVASSAHAEPPALYSTVWTPDILGFDQCMQQAMKAVTQAGGQDVVRKIGAPDLGWVDAHFGDYAARIDCLIYRGMVVFMVAGPNAQRAASYQDQIVRSTQQGAQQDP